MNCLHPHFDKDDDVERIWEQAEGDLMEMFMPFMWIQLTPWLEKREGAEEEAAVFSK